MSAQTNAAAPIGTIDGLFMSTCRPFTVPCHNLGSPTRRPNIADSKLPRNCAGHCIKRSPIYLRVAISNHNQHFLPLPPPPPALPTNPCHPTGLSFPAKLHPRCKLSMSACPTFSTPRSSIMAAPWPTSHAVSSLFCHCI
jgi:hypothetical protein